jgi:hypothetical protein
MSCQAMDDTLNPLSCPVATNGNHGTFKAPIMLQRLATVIHWLAILLAVGWSVMIYNIASQDLDRSGTWWVMIGGTAVIWAIGWGTNFVLTGRTTLIPD